MTESNAWATAAQGDDVAPMYPQLVPCHVADDKPPKPNASATASLDPLSHAEQQISIVTLNTG